MFDVSVACSKPHVITGVLLRTDTLMREGHHSRVSGRNAGYRCNLFPIQLHDHKVLCFRICNIQLYRLEVPVGKGRNCEAIVLCRHLQIIGCHRIACSSAVSVYIEQHLFLICLPSDRIYIIESIMVALFGILIRHRQNFLIHRPAVCKIKRHCEIVRKRCHLRNLITTIKHH